MHMRRCMAGEVAPPFLPTPSYVVRAAAPQVHSGGGGERLLLLDTPPLWSASVLEQMAVGGE